MHKSNRTKSLKQRKYYIFFIGFYFFLNDAIDLIIYESLISKLSFFTPQYIFFSGIY